MKAVSMFLVLAIASLPVLGQAPNKGGQNQSTAQQCPPACVAIPATKARPATTRRTTMRRTVAAKTPTPPAPANLRQPPEQSGGFNAEQLGQIKGLLEAIKPNITIQAPPAPNVIVNQPAPQVTATLPPIDFTPITDRLDRIAVNQEDQKRIGNRTNTLLEQVVQLDASTNRWLKVNTFFAGGTFITTGVTAVGVWRENDQLGDMNRRLSEGLDGVSNAVTGIKFPGITVQQTVTGSNNGGAGGTGGAGGAGGAGGTGGSVTGSGNASSSSSSTSSSSSVASSSSSSSSSASDGK